MLELASVLTSQLSIRAGEIIRFEAEGYIVVRTTSSDRAIRALFLRTSSLAPPAFQIGDAVLVAVDDDESRGYVLGEVASYVPPAESAGEHKTRDVRPVQTADLGGDGEAGSPSHSNVEISLPRKASDVMRLKGKKIYIEAGEEIQLTCGGGTILIDKRGKIVVRGTEIVSRARRTNKIKGASVAIN